MISVGEEKIIRDDIMSECIDQLMAKTPTGEIYVMRAFPGGKVTIELLQHQIPFEPKITIHNGAISFSGKYSHRGTEYEVMIPGTNAIVKFYEKATND